MTTLLKKLRKELYQARAEGSGSIAAPTAAEVLSLLEENVPTRKELRARRALMRTLERMRAAAPKAKRRFSSTEEIQREDRTR